jgi:uncharacterized protein
MQFIFVILGFAIFVLVYGFVLSHFVPKRFYSFLNILMALGSVVFSRLYGLTFEEMGLGQEAIKNGLLYGLLVILPIASAIAIMLLIPRLRHFFTDQPSKLAGKRSVLYELGFRVPFGTAFSEEILFRAVLLGLLLNHYSVVTAIVASSVVFGLWHIAPTWQTLRKNLALQELVGSQKSLHGLSILGAVVSTAVAGIAFAWLRTWSGSVIAAWIAHCAINSFSIAGGLLAHRFHLKANKKS